MQVSAAPAYAPARHPRPSEGKTPALARRTRSNPRFDWTFVALTAWMLAGLYLDGWAHNHLPSTLETFFTPWHGVLYSGFGATAGFLAWAVARDRAVPVGYHLSLAGAALFLLGGVADLLWHQAFGIEANSDALFSPTHLTLVLGGSLLMTGPLRAAWHRVSDRPTMPLPALLSLLILLSALTFITEYSHPFFGPNVLAGTAPSIPGDARASESFAFYQKTQGVLGMLVHGGLLTGLILFTLRRWTLPLGSLTLLFTANGALMSVLHDQQALVPLAALAGAAADGLVHLLRPSIDRPVRLRLFAFAMPAIYYALYVAALHLAVGVWWTVHVATGAVALVGVVGWLLSYLMVPPPLPATEGRGRLDPVRGG